MCEKLTGFGPDITRGHPMAPYFYRWHPQIHCCRGDIEGRSSGLESPRIDRHPVSPTAVLAATDPNLLIAPISARMETTKDFNERYRCDQRGGACGFAHCDELAP